MKILNLILFSESKEYNIMRNYIRRINNKQNIEYYFYMYNEELEDEYKIEGDMIYIRGKETFIPGILEKTIKVLEIMKDRDYDYIIRSNASTIVNFRLLKEKMEEIKNEINNDYVGVYKIYIKELDIEFVTGTNIILSKKLVKYIIDNKEKIDYELIDDISIGKLMKDKFKIRIIENAYTIDNKGEYEDNIIIYRYGTKVYNRKKDIKHMFKLLKNFNKIKK